VELSIETVHQRAHQWTHLTNIGTCPHKNAPNNQ
jgi:hypothetical protein